MKKLYKISVFLLMCLLMKFASATVHTVNVEDFIFSPSAISVTVGDTVMWMWVSGVHTATSTSVPLSAAGWNQPIDQTHTSFSYRVEAAGTYSYQCNFHFSMGMIGNISATLTEVSQIAAATRLTILGNIVTDEIKISYNLPNTSQISVHLIDLTGKVVRTFAAHAHEGVNTEVYQVADLPRGLYILSFQTTDVDLARRVILQ